MAVAYTKPLCTAGSSHPYLLDAKDSLKTGVRNVKENIKEGVKTELSAWRLVKWIGTDELPDVIKKLRLILEPISGNVSYHVIAGTTELGRPQWSGRRLLDPLDPHSMGMCPSFWTAQAFFCPGCLRKRSQKIQAKNGTPPVLNPQHK
ncbi:715_t:CDS:2 [Funneliformis geosporum]|nr:715_t:CDS:2 [Funneliformis geosporum]